MNELLKTESKELLYDIAVLVALKAMFILTNYLLSKKE